MDFGGTEMKDAKEYEIELIGKDKKMIKVHSMYLAIIFILLSVFLILLAPLTVCPEAFERFSFASTIVSIVLAVVSIVYSFRTKSNSSENMAGIREIERSIDSKLEKFDSLKTEIVEGVKGLTRPIETEVSNIRLGQVETSNQMKQMFEKMTQKETESQNADGQLFGSSSFYGNILMYMLCKSKATGKGIDFEKIGLDINDNYDYFWGFWIALTALQGQPFEYSDNNRVLKVLKYDETQLGNESYWRGIIEGYKNKDDAKKYLDAIDVYFSEKGEETDNNVNDTK